MKKLYFILILVAFAAIPKMASAAINSSTVWELRADATANNVNGGGFNASNANVGTDYSQQTTAHLTITDLVIGADNTTVTSALTPFDSLDPGNILHITAGTNFTAGWYEVVSVSTGVATLDRAAGTAASTGGTAYLGGAMSLNSTLDDDFFESAVAGNTIWVKNGSYTLGEAVSVSAAGTDVSPILLKGYNSARGDAPTGSNRPSIATGANGFYATTYWEIHNLIFTGTGSSVVSSSNEFRIIGSKMTNTSITAGRSALNFGYPRGGFAFNNEAISYRGNGISVNISASLLGNYIHDSNIGINAGYSNSLIAGNVIENNVTSAIAVSSSASSFNITIFNNTLYGSEAKTGTGISIVTGVGSINILNNIIYGFATGVSHADAGQTGVYLDYNDYYNNTTDRTNVATGANDQAINPSFTNVAQVTGTAGVYDGTNKITDATKDFSNVVDNQDFVYIISGTGVTAGQYKITAHTATTITIDIDAGNSNTDTAYQVTTGRNFAIGTGLKALGFPGVFQAGLSTGYMDIGAVQRQEPAGGGTTCTDFGSCMFFE